MGDLAPIALFAFRRPEHLTSALTALAGNPEAAESDLTIFVDGPRRSSDVPQVEAVRRIARDASGFRTVSVVESDVNLGLSRSMIGGIGSLLDQHDRVIVVEDDILVSPVFLKFMNEHLAAYADESAVASVHAYVYPHAAPLPETFFIKGADCWGWGTWRRAWAAFDPDGASLLARLRERGLVGTFDFEGTAPYEEMLIDQVAGRNDSWAVRWYASALLSGMVTLYPSRSLAINIGEDGEGTHRGSSRVYAQQLSVQPVPVVRIPVSEDPAARAAFRAFFRDRYNLPTSALGLLARRWARRFRAVVRR